MKQFFLFALLASLFGGLQGQTSLAPGDIAFVGYQMTDPDRFAFVLLADIQANTSINFTDKGWDGTAFVTTLNEGTCTWTAATALTAGTVITIEGSGSANTGSVSGQLHELHNTPGETGDQILAYQGLASSPTFLAGISSREWSLNTQSYEEDECEIPGSLGLYATVFGRDTYAHFSNGVYRGCITTGSKAQLLSEINHPMNWVQSIDTLWPVSFPAFTVTPTAAPEPGTSLSPGDIAFVAYQMEVPSKFAFVLLTDVAVGTRLHFTDAGWNGSRFYAILYENSCVWSADSALSAGTVVAIEGESTTYGNMCGSLDWLDQNNMFFENGDQILAFQATLDSPQFIAGLSTKNWTTNALVTEDTESELPTSLALHTTAFGLEVGKHLENGVYLGCITTGSKAQLLSEINHPMNWVQSADTLWPGSFPTFTVTPTAAPEPGTSLTPGDIAFIAYDMGVSNQFAFVLLADIAAGTRIHFTDEGWTGSRFHAGFLENSCHWLVDSALGAGTVVEIAAGVSSFGSLCGALDQLNEPSNQDESGDQILAFQGTLDNPQFIAGLSSVNWLISPPGVEKDESELPSALSLHTTAFGLEVEGNYSNGSNEPSYNYGYYRGCFTTGSKAQLLSEINHPMNWVQSIPPVWPPVMPSFTVTPDDEPWPGLNLVAGDIAFVGFEDYGPKSFAFALLVDVPIGTRIHFTDEGWSGSRFYAGFEETSCVWSVDSALSAGTVIEIRNDTANFGYVCGRLDKFDDGYGESGDQILAFQGTPTHPQFLAGFSNTIWAVSSLASDEHKSVLPDSLALHETAFGMDADWPSAYHLNGFYYFGCISTGSRTQLLREINHPMNWTFPSLPPPFLAFTITPTDEPWPGTILEEGCVSLIAYQMKHLNGFAFVLLEDVAANTQIRFTNEAWSGDRFYASFYDNACIWGTDSALAAGTIVTVGISSSPVYYEIDVSHGYSCGWIRRFNVGPVQPGNGDQIIAFQGNHYDPDFITSLSSGTWDTSSSILGPHDSNLPASLSLGSSAIGWPFHLNNGSYTGTTVSGTSGQLSTAFHTASNWTRLDNLFWSWPSSFPTITVAPGGGCCVVAAPAFAFTTSCQDSSVSLVNNTTGADALTSLAWDVDGDGLTDYTNNGNFTHSYSSPGVYAVSLITSRGGCTDTLSQTIVVGSPPAPQITASGPLSLCDGDTLGLSAPTGYSSYLWSNGSASQDITVAQPGVYSLTVAYPNGCESPLGSVTVLAGEPPAPLISTSGPATFCEGDSVTLFAPSGFSGYAWSTGDSTASITVFAGGTYSLALISPEGCVSPLSDTTLVLAPTPAAPDIVAAGPTSFCEGEQLQLSAVSSENTFLWSTGETTSSITVSSAGTYSVSVANPTGCVSEPAMETIVVFDQPDAPALSLSGDAVFCEGDSIQIFTPTGFFEYLWSTGENTFSITVSASGTYSLQGISVNGCESEATDTTVQVLDYPLLPAITQLSGTDQLSSTVSGTHYEWFLNGNLLPDSTQTIDASMYGNGAYTVIVYNGPCGSPVSDVFDVGTAGIGLDAFSKLSIHPNPSFGLFTLEGEQSQALPLRISVFNLLGQQIRPTEVLSPATQWTHTIDLSDQPNGVYQLRLDNGQQLAHKQLLLQR